MSEPVPKLIILESVDSTNNYAMALTQNERPNSGDAVFAMEQTAGKGRRGKVWKSQSGKDILLTLMVQMQWLPVQEQFKLSAAVALACRDLFALYVGENLRIKWPNDIFINDRKAGGILIENVVQGNLWQWAIIGIGLNIGQESFEKDSFKAISLKQITGHEYDILALAGALHRLVLKRLNQLKSGGGIKLIDEYNAHLFRRGEMVKLKKGNIVFETRIDSISSHGELITSDALERRFGFDEIQWAEL